MSTSEDKLLVSCEGTFLVPGFDPCESQSGTWRVLFERNKTSSIELCQNKEVYKLIARGAAGGKALLLVPLTSVSYHIVSDTWHEVEVHDGRKFALRLSSGQKCQQFLVALRNILKNVEKRKTLQFLEEHEIFVEPSLSLDSETVPMMISDTGGVAGHAPSSQQGAVTPPSGPASSSSHHGVATPPGEHDRSAQTHALMLELQTAVQTGDAEEAARVAAQLARLRARVSVEEDVTPVDPTEQDVSVKIYIEDKHASAGPMKWQIKPSTCIKALKNRMLREHGFPLEVQRWIVGQRIAKDDDSLQSCGVRMSGMSVFVYLVSATSVGLSKRSFLARHGSELPPGRSVYEEEVEENPYMSMSAAAGLMGSVPVRVENPPPLPPRNKQARPEDMATYEEPLRSPETPAVQQAAPGLPAEVVMEEEMPSVRQAGWPCPACTFINEPTRPGCEQCSTPRPENYVVPTDYRLSQRELERLKKEEELEKLARQADVLSGAEHRIGMSTEQLDTFLQINDAYQSSRRRMAAGENVTDDDLQAQEDERRSNFQLMVEAEFQELIPNTDDFNCPICFDGIDVGEGVMLRECLHCFCKECLSDHVRHCEEAVVSCPFNNGVYSCTAAMQDREIKALVPESLFERHLIRSLDIAEHQAPNSYHCKTTNCKGWCLYVDMLNFFQCPVCGKQNCLTCKAIHENMNCREYQDDLRAKADNDVAARQSQEMLENMLQTGNALRCPVCNVVIQKKEGCDWVRCTMCKTEICWVTKGPRWGIRGPGDVTGGCMCGINGVRCHPQCQNCH